MWEIMGDVICWGDGEGSGGCARRGERAEGELGCARLRMGSWSCMDGEGGDGRAWLGMGKNGRPR